jgi:hypothetical protein
VEIFTMLSTQGAIWKYWRDILYAWAGATTLDFAPLFFMILLAIAYDRENQEPASAIAEDFRRKGAGPSTSTARIASAPRTSSVPE